MRWVTFMVFVVFALTLQVAVAPRLSLFGQRPDWLLVVVVFFALYAKPYDAVIGAGIVGIGADLMTIERLGLLTLSYALAAVLVLSIREYLFRYQSITQFVVTVFTCMLLQLGWLIYRRILYEPISFLPIEFLTCVIWSSLYTACWALPIHKAMMRLSRWFGITRPRYTFAGLSRLRTERV